MQRPVYITLVFAVALGAFLGGTWYARRTASPNAGIEEARILHYMCPMHPQYKSDRPGDCPTCGMRLVPVREDESGGAEPSVSEGSPLPPGTITIKPDKQQLLGVRFLEVKPRPSAPILRTTGRVAADENRVFRLNTSTELWVRKLYPPTTGSVVHKNDPLLEFYSTNFYSAAAAYMYALNTRDRTVQAEPNNAAQLSALSFQMRQAIETLQNLGVSDIEIAEMERTRKPSDLIILRSPADGIVLSRTASKGQWVASSTELYQIADLSRVWVYADLFENEAQYVRGGLPAKVTLPHQNQSFNASVSDVPPVFEEATRTMRIRLEVVNPKQILWPGMFVDIELPVRYPATLTAPSEAVLDTGLRKIVFVDLGNGSFEPREVETGWRHGGEVQIVKGLMEGERIVVSGNFLIDSESRLRAAATARPASTVEDPVCGMQVDPAASGGLRSEYQGKSYYFCSDSCKKKFDSQPSKYAVAAPRH